jgi:hypothetical protein
MTLLLLVLLAATLFACRSSEQSSSDAKQMSEVQNPPEPGPGVPPGQCRIVGTVVVVDPVLSGDTNDPCSKTPCKATVKVETVEGYGMGFEERIGNREINVRFTGTLGEMKVGSRFRATVTMGPAQINDTGKAPEFRIANFTIL